MDVVDFKVPTAPGDATTSAQVPAPESRQYRNPTAGSESPDTDSESPTFPDLAGFSMQVLDQPLDEIDPHAMVLPPRHFADELLRWYWRNMHPVFPFLHWPMFEGKYRSLWKQQTPPGHGQQAFEERLYLATLNMVLAQACFRYEAIPLTQRQQHADEFYKRSLRLVSVEALDTASIPVVQLLLLRAMYLYFSGRADRCWLISGAAIRVAIGLGLHLTPRRPLNQLEREVRRRVWYAGCVPLDQYGSPTHPRPAPCERVVTVVAESLQPLSAGPASSHQISVSRRCPRRLTRSICLQLTRAVSRTVSRPAWPSSFSPRSTWP